MDSRSTFEALYEAHCREVREFVHRRVPAAAADDVVADVFVAAWRRLDQVPRDELPWLLAIARGVLANRRRGEARQTALRVRLSENAVGRTEDPPDSFVGGGTVMRAMGQLSRQDQEVLLLVAWDGLSRADASRVLGITTGSFSVRLHRARRRLRGALAVQAEAAERQAGGPSAIEVI